ncbi:MAG: DUF4392 domain-containing protein [Gammaproteobacteria bacterium]|nr:DUF4392 domain-containing protein [Gammaproteobacteria bacterium]
MADAGRLGALENLLARDAGGRGIAALAAAARGQLAAAAHSLASHRAPAVAPAVAIVTGFYVPEGEPPAAETDGPIGSVQLAAGLIKAGIAALIVTDTPCAAAVQAAADAAAGVTVPVLVNASDDRDLSRLRAQILQRLPALSHLIALERVGPAGDGVPRNMRGADVSAHTAPLERLFDKSFFTTAPHTIGIGDGGNEIGMGRFSPELIARHISAGERIACRVATDHTLVCGVSNWGGAALLAALACMRPDLKGDLLAALDRDTHWAMLQAMVQNGPAVDGVTRQQTLTVDGLDFTVHGQFIDDLLQIMAD